LQLKHQQGQSLTPRPHPGRAPRVGGQDEVALAALVEAHPSATIEEMRGLWQEQTGVLLPHSTMHDALRRVGVRRVGVRRVGVRRVGVRFKKNTSGQGTR